MQKFFGFAKKNKKNMGDKEYFFTKLELKDLIENVVDKYDGKSIKQFEIIDLKLTQIEKQTTKTNGRVTDLEKKVFEMEKDGVGRALTCPYIDKINETIENSVTTKTLKKAIIQVITIVGIFFTILFGLLRLLIESGRL